MTTYAIGAYGCGNLGDELIFLGMRQRWNDLVRVVSYDKVAKDNECTVVKMYQQLEEGDQVIIGGGFLFRDLYSIEILSNIINECLALGACIEIRGADIGRNLSTNELKCLKKLLLKCNHLEFRSIYGVGLAKILVGDLKEVEFHKDYSFHVPPDTSFVQDTFSDLIGSDKKLLGLVLSQYGASYINAIANALWVIEQNGFPIQVVCLPHCQHTFNDIDRDLLYINEFNEVYLGEAFTVDWISLTSKQLKGIYSFLDGVITTRLHPFYFAIENLIPVLAMRFDRIEDAYSLIPLLSPEYNIHDAVLVDKLFSTNIWDFLKRL